MVISIQQVNVSPGVNQSGTNIVLEVIDALDLGVPSLVVDVQVPKHADAVVGLYQPPTRMSLKPLTHYGILDCDVVDGTIDREGLIPAPRYADVVKDEVAPFSNADRILTRATALSHADPNVPHNSVVGVRP